MKAKLIGYRKADFTTKEGTRIVGTQLFFAYPWDGVVGEIVEKVFASNKVKLPENFVIGKEYNIIYNRYGKVDSITL